MSDVVIYAHSSFLIFYVGTEWIVGAAFW